MDNYDYSAVGQRIRVLRKRKGYNQKDLAEAIEEAKACGKGYIIDCVLDMDEMVRPMVGGGSHITDFMKI